MFDFLDERGTPARPGCAAAGQHLVMYNNRNDGPPDLDELWRDFQSQAERLVLGQGGGETSNSSGSGGGVTPDPTGAGIGAGLIIGLVALVWLGSGFFIVQEGEQAVILTFGKFSRTVEAASSIAARTVPVASRRSASPRPARPRSAAMRWCRPPACATPRC